MKKCWKSQSESATLQIVSFKAVTLHAAQYHILTMDLQNILTTRGRNKRKVNRFVHITRCKCNAHTK